MGARERPPGMRTRARAAGGGLSILRARANGCPWDERTCALRYGGHLEVLAKAPERPFVGRVDVRERGIGRQP